MNQLQVQGVVRSSRPFVMDVKHTSACDAGESQDIMVCVAWPLERPAAGEMARVIGVPMFQRDNVIALLAFSVDRVDTP